MNWVTKLNSTISIFFSYLEYEMQVAHLPYDCSSTVWLVIYRMIGHLSYDWSSQCQYFFDLMKIPCRLFFSIYQNTLVGGNRQIWAAQWRARSQSVDCWAQVTAMLTAASTTAPCLKSRWQLSKNLAAPPLGLRAVSSHVIKSLMAIYSIATYHC